MTLSPTDTEVASDPQGRVDKWYFAMFALLVAQLIAAYVFRALAFHAGASDEDFFDQLLMILSVVAFASLVLAWWRQTVRWPIVLTLVSGFAVFACSVIWFLTSAL